MYRTLDPDKIVATLEQLERRISERFPGAGSGAGMRRADRSRRREPARTAKLARPI